MIETRKLPFGFDAFGLKADLGNFTGSDWTPHFNTSNYEGEWSGIALRAACNAHVALYPDPSAESFESTAELSRCSYIPDVLSKFECDMESVRFLRLGAGAVIREHRDHKLGIEDGVARIHVPVETNSKVEFWMNNQIIPMKEGEAWYLNFNLPHKVFNHSDEHRTHLVIDCIANDWLRNLIL